jgi:hypothetical protein
VGEINIKTSSKSNLKNKDMITKKNRNPKQEREVLVIATINTI